MFWFLNKKKLTNPCVLLIANARIKIDFLEIDKQKIIVF
jgi:hypothetical protein